MAHAQRHRRWRIFSHVVHKCALDGRHESPEKQLIPILLNRDKLQRNCRQHLHDNQTQYDFPQNFRSAALPANQRQRTQTKADDTARRVHHQPPRRFLLHQQRGRVYQDNQRQQHRQRRDNRLLRHISRSFRSSSGLPSV